MIRPGQRCLIVCSIEHHPYAGWECTAMRFAGVETYALRNGTPFTVTDAWEIKIPGAKPTHSGLPYGARAAWLMPLDDDNDQFIRESIQQVLEDGVSA